MPSCNTYHFTWISLTLGVGYLFMAAPAKCSRCLTLDKRYLLTATLPDLQLGIAPVGPSVPEQPLLLGCGVAPLGCSCTITSWHSRPLPRPQTWGNSSWPPSLGHGVLPASPPNLRHGVAPLSHAVCGVALHNGIKNTQILVHHYNKDMTINLISSCL